MLTGEAAYEADYNTVIGSMSRVCQHMVAKNRNQAQMKTDEQEVMALSPKIIGLTLDYTKHFPVRPLGEQQTKKCFLQTLLKGSFSLLGVKMPHCALKISSCNIQIFFEILEWVLKCRALTAKAKGIKQEQVSDEVLQ